MTETVIARMLSTRQVAAILGLPPKSLNDWAYHGKGPPYRKVGTHRRYPEDALQEWINTRPTGGEWDKAASG